jgi:ATP-dependent Zn protease
MRSLRSIRRPYPRPAMTQEPKARRRSLDPRTRTAFREAGHAVLSAAINDKPHHVSIRAAHETLGRTRQKMFARPTSLAQVYLAGFAAEHLLTGRRPRKFSIETGLAILAHTDPTLASTFEGIEVSDGYGAILHLLRAGVRAAEDELRREVDRFYEIARESVAVVWPSVKAVARALLEREELDREGLDEVIGDADIYQPVFAAQREHGSIRLCDLGSWAPSLTRGSSRRA